MFKRLKRIENLMNELVQIERRVEEIVQQREIKYALWEARQDQPWKCHFKECAVEPYHLHVLPPPPNSGLEKHEG